MCADVRQDYITVRDVGFPRHRWWLWRAPTDGWWMVGDEGHGAPHKWWLGMEGSYGWVVGASVPAEESRIAHIQQGVLLLPSPPAVRGQLMALEEGRSEVGQGAR